LIDFRHHLYLRKLVHQRLVPYPHPDKWKRNLDRLIFAVSIIGPAASLPQVSTIWVDKNASGVSSTSWMFFTLFAALWLFYGLAHKVKPIIINSAISVFINTLVVVGVLLYS
jgi:uncharacterized protein with PQ loop repeat